MRYYTNQEFIWKATNLKDVYETDIFAMIYGFSQDGNSSFEGTYKYIAEPLKISERKAKMVISALIKKGLITKTSGKKGRVPNKYKANPKKLEYNNSEQYARLEAGNSEQYARLEAGNSEQYAHNNNGINNNINNIYDAPNGAIEDGQPRKPDSLEKVEAQIAGDRSNIRQVSGTQTTKSEKSEDIGKKYTLAEYRQYVDKTYPNKTETEKRRLLNKAIKEQWEIADKKPEEAKSEKKMPKLDIAKLINVINVIAEAPETRICPICKAKIDEKFSACENGCGTYHGENFVTYENETNAILKTVLLKRKNQMLDQNKKAN